jgi:hypothetical protein
MHAAKTTGMTLWTCDDKRRNPSRRSIAPTLRSARVTLNRPNSAWKRRRAGGFPPYARAHYARA